MTIQETFDELVLHHYVDVLLTELAEALARRAKKADGKVERKLRREEARHVKQVSDYISKFLYGRKDGR